MKMVPIALLTILVLSSLVFVAHAATPTFGTPTSLGPGYNPNVQSVGSNVYVTWTDKSGGIFFKASVNDGLSWKPAVRVGNGGQIPIMSANGNNVYIVWVSNGINFVASSDNGATWTAKPIKLAAAPAITPFIASDSSVVSVVYLSGVGGGSLVTSSSNSGKNWTTPFQYSNGPEPQIAVSGPNVYVVADSLSRSGVQFGVSHDSGKSWKINALESGSEAWVAATGSNVYIAWETKGSGSVVWFLSSSTNGDTYTTKTLSTGLPGVSKIPDAWNPMINAMGNTVWVGIEAFGASPQNWMLTSTDGGANWISKSVSGIGHTNGFIFSVASTDGQNVYAMWLEQQTSTTWTVFVAYSADGGQTWSTNSIGSSDPNNDVAIGSIASDGTHGLAAWQESATIFFAGS